MTLMATEMANDLGGPSVLYESIGVGKLRLTV